MLDQQTVKKIREQSLKMDQTRAFSKELLQYIIDHGWFKLFVPEELGGKMAGLPDALKIFEQTSWADGSFGWIVTIGAGGGYFAPFMESETAASLFSPAEAVIAGSGTVGGTAKKTDGGFVLNGEWKYCSGSLHATMFTGNAIIEDHTNNESNPEIQAFIMLPDEVEIDHDWNAFGLRATESHTVRVRNLFVPEERTFSLLEKKGFKEEPLFDFPFLQFAEASFAAISIGIAKHFVDEARSLAHSNQATWERGSSNRFAFVIHKIDQLEKSLIEAVEHFYDIIQLSWEAHVQGKALHLNELNQISDTCKHVSRTALASGSELIPYLGISAVMEHSEINRIWRDLQTACQHTLLVPFQ